MRIVICGSPHSGKSVFVENLSRILPANGLVVIRACPDGEGMWSGGPNRTLIELVREKDKFTPEFVKETCRLLDEHDDGRIVLVDVGGYISKENEEIFKHCDGYIVICRDDIDPSSNDKANAGIKDWVRACNKAGLKQIAVMSSTMTKDEKLTHKRGDDKKSPVVGRLSRLIRGGDYTKSRVIRAIGRYICELTRGMQVDNDFLDIDGIKLARLLNCASNNNIKPGGDSRVVSWDMESIRKIYELVDDPTGHDELLAENMSKKSKKKILKALIDADEDIEKKELADFKTSMKDLPLELTIGNINDNHIMVALCLALKQKGVPNILINDALRKKQYRLQVFPEKGGRMVYNSGSVLAREVESKSSVFMDIDILNNKMTQRDYQSISIPEVEDNKALYLSGRMPQWLFASICVSSGAKEIYVLNPGKGFICIKSDDKEKLGTIVDQKNVPEIDISKYFELKKAKGLPLESKALNELLVDEEDRCEEDKTDFDFIGGREHEDVVPETVFSGRNPPDSSDDEKKKKDFYRHNPDGTTSSRKKVYDRVREERKTSGLREILNVTRNRNRK